MPLCGLLRFVTPAAEGASCAGAGHLRYAVPDAGRCARPAGFDFGGRQTASFLGNMLTTVLFVILHGAARLNLDLQKFSVVGNGGLLTLSARQLRRLKYA